MVVKITIPNLADEFDELNAEARELIHQVTVASALNAVTSLQQATPVDTGRARSSWNLSTEEKDFRTPNSSSISSAALLSTTALTISEDNLSTQLYISNSAPYINELNRGKSDQAPARFIERTLLQFYDPDGVIVDEIKLPTDSSFDDE